MESLLLRHDPILQGDCSQIWNTNVSTVHLGSICFDANGRTPVITATLNGRHISTLTVPMKFPVPLEILHYIQQASNVKGSWKQLENGNHTVMSTLNWPTADGSNWGKHCCKTNMYNPWMANCFRCNTSALKISITTTMLLSLLCGIYLIPGKASTFSF